MAERLKDMFFTQESMTAFADAIRKVYPEFDTEGFKELVFDESFEDKEVKDRMSHTTRCLQQFLPESYPDALEVLVGAAPHVRSFEAMCLPDTIGQFGLDEWDLSLDALGHIGRRITGELAIRPFLDRDPEKVLPYLLSWSEDESPQLRRLVSEGTRPRLPWAMALPRFKKDPRMILPLLEKLKDDESEDVRRSVANHLNDISKDNPDIALEVCAGWYGQSENTDRILKHACRTLLKGGDKRALQIFGYSDPSTMRVENLRLEADTIAIGNELRFSYDLILEEGGKVRLEYAVCFVKARGRRSRKVFKQTENRYAPGTYSFKRRHSFADMSTRRHYPGTHRLEILVNGEEKAGTPFEITR
jgi:3-methyladenine DNA glycosylase AlkC